MRTLLVALILLAVGCGLEEGQYQKTRHNTTSMAITNAEGEDGVLRTGTSVNMTAGPDIGLKANTVYTVLVSNLTTGTPLARADLLSDIDATIPLSTVAHDIGEFDDVKDEHSLQIKINAPNGATLADLVVPVTPHVGFSGHGFQVDEVQPPHVYSADASGKPLNAFVVGGPPDPGETAAPIYAAGKGFPAGVTTVDIYIMKDRDRWQGATIPAPGQEGYVFGPVVGRLDRGVLPATRLDWQPGTADVGTYDIVVDVNRDGKFDYSFSQKDGADGEDKVGFTLQYGQAWFRAKAALTAKHVLVNLAYDSQSKSDGRWTNTYHRDSRIYTYVNPPVMLKYHAFVTKLVVPHQSWSMYWNNPERQIQSGPHAGGIPIPQPVQVTGGTTQHSCTNSPPVAAINPALLPVDGAGGLQAQKFDVVFDFGNDGIYDPGQDLLDVVGHTTGGDLVTAKDLEALADDQIFGFQIKK